MRLIVAIPVKDEERHIKRVFTSASKLTKYVYFFDSNSTDQTRNLIHSTSAELVNVPSSVTTFSQKANYIYSYFEFADSLVLVLHADEVIDNASASLLLSVLESSHSSDVFKLTRQSYFLGNRLAWGKSSQRMIRLAGYKTIAYQNALLDEQVFVKHMSSRVFDTKIVIIDDPLISPSEWFAKHNRYSDLEAFTILNDGCRGKPLNVQAYYLLPIFLRPFLLFFVRYFLFLGFLDGVPGLAYHLSHGVVYRLMVDVKIFHGASRKTFRGDQV